MRRRDSRILLIALFVWPLMLWGQTDTGTITGMVRDTSAASVTQVKIGITDARTNSEVFNTMSDNSGRYTAPALKPSEYVITAESAGFKREIRRGITLDVNQVAVIDFTLEVGQINQSVEVTGAAPLMQTQSAELGDVVEHRQVVELPLNGRFFVDLVALTAGVTPASTVANPNNDTFLGARAGQPGVEVNGQRPGSNNYTVDSIDNRESTVSSIILYPPVDAIQEFKVQTGNQEARFGTNPGATVNVVIRSGTNELHGSLYEFLRNNDLDAKNYFDRTTSPIPSFKMNQFGGTAGGPIVRNKTFFFGYYEGELIHQQQTYLDSVPTALMRAGNFSELGVPLYDPSTYNAVTGLKQLFPHNTIPTERLDVPALRMTALNYPLPNASGVGNNFYYNPNRISNSKGFGARIDHQFREKDNLFGRFILQNFLLDDPSILSLPILPSSYTTNKSPIESAQETLNARGLAIGETHVFSPAVVNELRLGFTREHVYFPNPLQGDNAANAVGIPFVNNPAIAYSSGLPTFSVTGFTGVGESGIQPFIVTDNNFEEADSLTWLNGRHTFQFGGDVIRRQYNFFQSSSQRGSFSFNGQFTSQLGVGNTGSGMADFLLGYPSSSALKVLTSEVGQRQIEVSGFAQDTWRITDELTFTYGLRYELFTPRSEVANRQSNFDPTYPGGAVVVASSSATCGRALRCIDWKDFAPRGGFAYQVNQKLVVRGSYGIFYDNYSVDGFGGTSGLMYQPPFTFSNTINAPLATPVNRLEDGIPPVIIIPLTNGKVLPTAGAPYTAAYEAPYGRNPYVEQRNITLEQGLTKDLVLTASYVGNKGTRNMYTTNINQAVPGPGGIAARRPYPDWPDISSMLDDSQSSYNALQLKVQRRMANGFMFLAGYTYAKALDDGQGESSVIQNAYDRHGDRGRSGWDMTHRFIFSSTYELPFGPGKPMGRNLHGLAAKLAGGWNLNGIVTVSTG
ncbi:MAG TPA: TonB-dependent receptor, partial [Bryobacteraceae bacterium]